MRYYRHPVSGVGTTAFAIHVTGVPATRNLRGGNGSGGAYAWSNMLLSPPEHRPITGRQAAIAGATTSAGGTADLALYNSATSTWLFRLSSMNYASFSMTFR